MILTKIFGDPYKKAVKALQPVVERINALEKDFEKLSDEELKNKTVEFKTKLSTINYRLDAILPEAFAAVREASKRTLGLRHFDVQLIGGIVLHQGKIAEMKTGEGKTLVATLPLYLNSLLGKGAHLVTVNDYLARRDAEWMGKIYHALGISVGVLNHEKSYLYQPKERRETPFGSGEELVEVSRQEAYAADITYGTNNEFGFDYLRDNMVLDLSQVVQRDLFYAIVDEVDSVLIDEARTPLIISAPAEESADLYYKFARLIPQLQENIDYNVDEKMRTAILTEEGIAKMEKLLGIKNIYEEGGVELVHHLEQALKAYTLFKKDRDYVVKDGEVIIVDEFTGRLMPGRRYSEGLHQAIEAKEGVKVREESLTLATISFQNYFRMYQKLAGMTGTAATEAEEFYKIYGLEVVVIPTHKPMIRVDLPDKIYKTEEAKFKAIIEEVKKRYEKGQPVLIGTISIEKNEFLSNLLTRHGIPHEILNAKNHEREAQIIAQAGKRGAVTLATNMAGRGVDIILGGKPESYSSLEEWQEEHQKVVELGGLCVIGTERHEARRVDNQLRGRSGRQGDPGVSMFFVSLEDDLMRIFGGERIKNLMTTLKFPEDQPIEHPLISKSIEQAQKRVESYNFDLRKHLVEYDDVMNKQREVIYTKRRKILKSENLREEIVELIKKEIKNIVEIHFGRQSIVHSSPSMVDDGQWTMDSGQRDDREEIIENIKAIIPQHFLPADLNVKIREFVEPRQLTAYLFDLVEEAYQKKEKEQGEMMRLLEKMVYLRVIDSLWIRHLTEMDYLRQGIGLRGYGQRDPLVEYKFESHQMFNRLLERINAEVAETIFKVSIVPDGTAKRQRQIQEVKQEVSVFRKSSSQSFSQGGEKKVREKVGRNDPCPCGSGKKYKKCCGK